MSQQPDPTPTPSRRRFLRAAALGATALPAFAGCASLGGGRYADRLTQTPRQTAGPFYPDPLPLNQDNDLLVLSDELSPADGEVTHLRGQVLSVTGEPMRNAEVEIWQADATGAYIHSESEGFDDRDQKFQGFGHFETDSTGRYYFRTIKPGKYPGRAPHIHMLVRHRGQRLLTTQLYVRGDPGNDRDDILMEIPDLHARNSILIDFSPLPGSETEELFASADIVVGRTPEESDRW